MKTFVTLLSAFSLVACHGGSKSEQLAQTTKPEEKLSEQACQAKAEALVLKTALKTNQSANVVGSKILYGSTNAFGKVLLVSISDEVQPSSYGIYIDARTGIDCGLGTPVLLREGLGNEFKETLKTEPLAKNCEDLETSQVLKKAKVLNDTAEISGTKVLYGTKDSFANISVVRVSDETEPSDYIVFSENLKNDKCKVLNIQNSADGSLPEVEGLE